MIIHKKCDIFDSGADIICHQVNCQGEMNSRLAQRIKEKYPKVYDAYKGWCEDADANYLLGKVQLIKIRDINDTDSKDPAMIANIFGQLNYGYDGTCYTDYTALRRAFCSLNSYCKNFFNKSLIIAIPFKLECARSGGYWETIYKILEECLTDVTVLVCECDKG